MENQTRIYLQDLGDLQLYDNVPVSLNYSIAEVQDISKKNSSFSKTITIPGTKLNNDLLGHLFNISVKDSSFDINRKVKCTIYGGDVILMKGYFRLMGIKKVSPTSVGGDEFIEYEALIFDQATNFYDKIGELLLEDLDFSQYDHTYGYSSIVGSSGHTAEDIWTYPMLYNGNTTSYNTKDFQPAIYLKAYIDKAFQEVEYSYESNFFESDYFKKLIIPFNGDKMVNTQAEIDSRKFQVGMTAATNNYTFSGSVSTVFYSGFTVPFNSDNNQDLPYFDSGNTYNVATYKYTSANNQIIDFRFRIKADSWVQNQYNTQLKLWNSFGSAPNSLQNARYQPKVYLYKNNNIIAAGGSTSNVSLGQLIPTGSTGYSQTIIDKTFSNIAASNGDVFHLVIKPEIVLPGGTVFKTGTTFSGPSVLPNYVFRFDTSLSAQTAGDNFFINYPHQTELVDGDTIYLNEFIPKNVKFKEVFSSIIKMFNLYIEEDDDFSNKLIIKTRDEYYSGNTAIDWTDKINIDKDIDIKFIPELQNKDFILTYKQDSDDFNKSYFEQTNEVYGQKKYVFDNDFLIGEKKNEVIFSPTPLVKNGFNLTVPAIVSQSPKNNIRILYKPDSWIQQSNLTWTFSYLTSGGTSQTASFATYPYAGHFDRPQYPTEDINFGQTPFLFYYDYGSLTDNNLANKYYFNFIDQLLDGRLVTAYFDLNYVDILNLRFNDKIFIKDTYYVINKVIDFDPISLAPTKVELLKVDEGIKFSTRNRKWNRPELIGGIIRDSGTTVGATGPTISVSPGGTLGKNDPTVLNTGGIVVGGVTNNVLNSRGTIVNGENNYVGDGTKAFILGDSNNVSGDETKAMVIGSGSTVTNAEKSFIVGDNNIIDGADNAIIFGNNITATTSDTTYIQNVNITESITINSGATFIFSGGTISGLDYLPLSGGVMTGPFTAQTIEVATGYAMKTSSSVATADNIAWGNSNLATGTTSVAIGGGVNSAKSTRSGIFAGSFNTVYGASGTDSAIIGGSSNNITNAAGSIIAGGYYNQINNTQNGFIGGGSTNQVNALYSSVLGGQYNIVNAKKASIIGGISNTNDGEDSGILAGSNNYIVTTSQYSAIIGGNNNSLQATNSVIIGGSFISATVNDAVYVPKLNVGILAGTPVSTLGVDANGFIVSGATGGGGGSGYTQVQPGSNITTGGTIAFPIVGLVASPSVNNLTFSGTAFGGTVQAGAGSFTSLSAGTLSGGTILSGGTNLYSIFAKIGDADITRVQPGSNITTGGTANNPIVNLAASPSVNNLTFSGTAFGGTVQAGAITATSLSAGTLSGGTILSGGTNLYSIFSPLGSSFTGGTVAGATTFNSSVTMNEDLTVDDIYQTSHYSVQTSNATQTTLATATLSSEYVYMIEANVCAGTTDTNSGLTCKIIGSFKNNGGTVTQIGELNKIFSSDFTGLADVNMDISGTSVRVLVRGQALTTIDWGCALIINRMGMGVI